MRVVKKLLKLLLVSLGLFGMLVLSTSLLAPSVANLIHSIAMTQPQVLRVFGQRLDGQYVLISEGVISNVTYRPDGSICYIDYQTQIPRCAKVPAYILTPFEMQ